MQCAGHLIADGLSCNARLKLYVSCKTSEKLTTESINLITMSYREIQATYSSLILDTSDDITVMLQNFDSIYQDDLLQILQNPHQQAFELDHWINHFVFRWVWLYLYKYINLIYQLYPILHRCTKQSKYIYSSETCRRILRNVFPEILGEYRIYGLTSRKIFVNYQLGHSARVFHAL